MEQMDTTRSQKQWEYNQAYGNLLETFLTGGRAIYPDYYGGAYLNGDAKLVVYLTGDEAQGKAAELQERTQHNGIITAKAAYSYHTLTDVMDIINEYMTTWPQDAPFNNVTAAALMEADNIIEVTLRENSPEARRLFWSNCCKFEGIRFVQQTRPADADAAQLYIGGSLAPISSSTATLGGGQKYATSTSYCSTAFTCIRGEGKWYETTGIVTAGHCISAGGYAYTANRAQPLGVCKYSKFGGTVDGAFIPRMNHNVTLTKAIHDSAGWTYLPKTTPYAVGSEIYRTGITTGLRQGTIASTNASVTYATSQVTLTNLIQHKNYSNSGDSGGLTFIHKSYNENFPVGVHSGGNKYDTCYACKASTILDTWDIELY